MLKFSRCSWLFDTFLIFLAIRPFLDLLGEFFSFVYVNIPCGVISFGQLCFLQLQQNKDFYVQWLCPNKRKADLMEEKYVTVK